MLKEFCERKRVGTLKHYLDGTDLHYFHTQLVMPLCYCVEQEQERESRVAIQLNT